MEGLEEIENALIESSKDKDLEVLKKEVLSMICKENLLEDYKSIVNDDKEFDLAASWLYEVLLDREKCHDCTAFARCIKKNDRGYVLKLYKDDNRYSYRRSLCDKHRAILPFINNVIYSDLDPRLFFLLVDQIKKYDKDVKESKSDFFRCIRWINGRSIDLSKGQFKNGCYVICENNNRSFLSKFLACRLITKGLKISYFDAGKTFSNVEPRDYAFLYEKIAKSDVIIINDIDKATMTYDFLSKFLLKVMGIEKDNKHMLFITSSIDDYSYLPPYHVSEKIIELIKELNVCEIIDPELFA